MILYGKRQHGRDPRDAGTDQGGKSLDSDTRDRLLFTAVIDIYEKLETLNPVLVFYKVGMWFASALGLGFLSLIIGILTGRAEVTFK